MRELLSRSISALKFEGAGRWVIPARGLLKFDVFLKVSLKYSTRPSHAPLISSKRRKIAGFFFFFSLLPSSFFLLLILKTKTKFNDKTSISTSISKSGSAGCLFPLPPPPFLPRRDSGFLLLSISQSAHTKQERNAFSCALHQ